MTRTYTFKNDEIVSLMGEKDTLMEYFKKQTAKIEKLQKELGDKSQELQVLKDKMRPIVDEYVLDQLDEFELVTKLDVKDGEIVVEIVDEIESFKEAVQKRKLKEIEDKENEGKEVEEEEE
jgi:hypothetical protein